jgi:predicted transcriptional regulator of viral defense system
MKSTEALAALGNFGKRVVTTSEAAALWQVSSSMASKTLSRLGSAGLVQEVRSGVWAVGSVVPDILEVVPVLTRPYPSYVSMYSALFRHGMIEQIPRSLHVISLGRPKRVVTTLGTVVIHHLQPELFGGYQGETSYRSGLASPEKALVDTVAVLSSRGGNVTLPEVELPNSFNTDEVKRWTEKIPSLRVRTIVTQNLDRIIELSSAGDQSAA